MEIKTDGQIYQEVKDMFEEHGGIDYDNRCNINRVRVDDIQDEWDNLIHNKYYNMSDKDIVHYFTLKIQELSQSNSPSGLTRANDESEVVDTPLKLGSKSFKCPKCKSDGLIANYDSRGNVTGGEFCPDCLKFKVVK